MHRAEPTMKPPVKPCSGLQDSGRSSRSKRLLIRPRESTIMYNMETSKEGVIIADKQTFKKRYKKCYSPI